MRAADGRVEPLEIAMVVCRGAELLELAAITLPVDQERERLQAWFRALTPAMQVAYRKSDLLQEVTSNGLMMPMVIEAMVQTLDRFSELGVPVLGSEDTVFVRGLARPLVKHMRPRDEDLSLRALRNWVEAASVPTDDLYDGDEVPVYARALDRCLARVDEARHYLRLLAEEG